MATLPVSTDLTGSAITEAQAKIWFTQLRDFLSGLLGTAGTAPNALATLQVPFAAGTQWVSGAYSVTTADRGKVLGIGTTVAVTLPAAATAGPGFMVAVLSFVNGAIVNSHDEAITLNAGESAILVCTGSNWWSLGREIPITYPISVANGGTGATTAAVARDNLAVVSRDHNYNAVGSLCFATIGYNSNNVGNPGTTLAGSALWPVGVYGTRSGETFYVNFREHATALSGTWRCLGCVYGGQVDYAATLWQRIS